jgi:zinc/manganese transport system ATP-binding protein
MLELEGVDVWLGGRRILDQVGFTIDEGEFTGLIGSNGAGKTTLLKVILGLLTPSAGTVRVDGSPRSRRSTVIGYVPQKIVLDPDVPLRARDLVALGVDGHRFGLPRRSAEKDRRVDEALAAVGAQSFADARVGRLSGGEQQRIMIAHALVGRPRLLLLDEPLATLDISSASEIVAVLSRIRSERGVAIFISAHDMNPLLPVMDSIAYLGGGRVACGTTDEVVTSEVLSRLYGRPVDVVRVRDRVLVLAGETNE